MDKIKEPVSFIIGQGDISALFAGDPALKLNSGSVFYKIAPAVGEGMERKAEYGELLSNLEFMRAARIIAQPDLSGTVRVAGAQGLTEIRLHRKKSEGAYVAATQQDADGRHVISLFDDYKAWLAWWADRYAGPNEESAANFIPPKVSLEEFLFTLHAVDSFRRVSYENMLNHIFPDRTYVKVPEFIRSMADSLKSLDIRWLLPAFLAVTPGVEQYQTAIDPQNIAVLLQHDFFTEGKLAAGEDVLVFGEAGQVMGVEFFRSWFTSCGLEINVAGSEGFQVVERLFIAPTVLTNHFVRMEEAEGGKAMVNHQAYTKEHLEIKLDELFGKAFAMEVTTVPIAEKSGPVPSHVPDAVKRDAAPSSVPDAPKSAEKSEGVPEQEKAAAPGQPSAPAQTVPKFCRNCGFKINPGAAFCPSCGFKMK